ncbi:hypothetical protein [Neptunicella sp. SCSIO 80796]
MNIKTNYVFAVPDSDFYLQVGDSGDREIYINNLYANDFIG